MTAHHLLIDAAPVEALAGATLPVLNPATGQVIATIAAGDAEDVDRAVRSARAAFQGEWSRWTPSMRAKLLLDFADLLERHYVELHLLDVADMGRPVGPLPTTGLQFCLDTIRYYAGCATRIGGATVPNSTGRFMSYTRHEPVGVVAAITPWNGPLESTLWKLLPPLAAGCTVVLKPAEDASLSALRVVELMYAELDLPSGVVNVVTGAGEVAGAALAAHPGVDKIAFTGSTEVGRAIVAASAASNLKRVSLELGGKSPNLVFADADLETAAKESAVAVFINTGQVCHAGTRIYVERSVQQEFSELLVEASRAMEVGDPMSPSTDLGPLVSRKQLERVEGFVSRALDEGAEMASGGSRLLDGGREDGYFLEPTVFTGVQDGMEIAREEIFGPVASVFAFDDEDEVVARANDTVYGLGAGIWTNRLDRAHRVAARLESGVVWLNSWGVFDPTMPFGGVKASGWGRELGEESMDDYISTKSVWLPVS
jgi:aldehyde dehydrogenase (NAD+)